MEQQKKLIKLDADAALVLFELLSRLCDETEAKDAPEVSTVKLLHRGEYVALVRLLGSLESELVEPFAKEYETLIRQSRRRLELAFFGKDEQA